MRAMAEVVREPDGSVTEYTEVAVHGDTVQRLMAEVFGEHWAAISAGPIVDGAAYEIRFTAAPTLSMLDGYLTIDTGPWHFHLCVNDHRAPPRPSWRGCAASPARPSSAPTAAPACPARGGCGSGTAAASR